MSPPPNSQIQSPFHAARRSFVCGLLLIVATTGCQALTTQQQQASPSQETVTVQLRQANRSPKNIKVPFTPEMRLQQVLDTSKAPFRNRLAYIIRTSPKTGEQHRLEANFGNNRRVSLETDYAIQPGDRVVIAEDTTSSFDRVMKSMLGRT